MTTVTTMAMAISMGPVMATKERGADVTPLLVWLSPSFPVGSFAYSHGLEWAVEAGDVRDAASLEAWLDDLLHHGGPWSDAVLLAHSHRAVTAGDDAKLAEVAALAAALASSREHEDRHGARADPLYRLLAWLSPAYPIGAFSYSHGVETAVEEGFIKDRASLVSLARKCAARRYGPGRRRPVRRRLAGRRGRGLARLRCHRRARGRLARHLGDGAGIAPAGRLVPVDHPHRLAARRARRGALERLGGELALPVAVALAAAAHGIALEQALGGYLHAFTANLISAALRTVPLGQTDGQLALAALETAVNAAARAAMVVASLDEVGTATPLLDWCSLRHETQYTRLFRS